uniref:Uncharacterized protein n=1 Tax=Zea mays TaxID=4577 RepID=C0P9F6_MAIZE|nr:unknown [Zea mays]
MTPLTVPGCWSWMRFFLATRHHDHGAAAAASHLGQQQRAVPLHPPLARPRAAHPSPPIPPAGKRAAGGEPAGTGTGSTSSPASKLARSDVIY